MRWLDRVRERQHQNLSVNPRAICCDEEAGSSRVENSSREMAGGWPGPEGFLSSAGAGGTVDFSDFHGFRFWLVDHQSSRPMLVTASPHRNVGEGRCGKHLLSDGQVIGITPPSNILMLFYLFMALE
ncbi:hypothetical protein GH722_02035 [Alphaproteobacteria bacterium HT1-32]|nr:hypothetical protein [Alphaproteobacteria bacterium HT1-32]